MNAIIDPMERVTLGSSRAVHYRHPFRPDMTACGLGPAPYLDSRRGYVMPADGAPATGPMKKTDEPLTCPRCKPRNDGTRQAA